ncbi:hypothetical protein [Actinophytocola sp.]|uniref:hypothetical protein n=1 Tax=Actinophytocola sp. TaxID=1872138 RepID=UPI00389AB6A1
MSKNELVTRQADPVSLNAGVPERATRVASWVGWHLFEITGVTVPTVFAVSVTPWWWLVSGVVGVGWTANEVRLRKQAAIRAGREVPATVEQSAATGSGEASSVDGKRVGGAQ